MQKDSFWCAVCRAMSFFYRIDCDHWACETCNHLK